MAVPPEFGMVFLSAAERGNVSVLQRLALHFENGEGPGKVLYSGLKTPEGKNALHLAAASGTTETCTFLIEMLRFDINGTCDRGETPLFGAIIQGNLPTAVFLINSGAQVTKCNNFGETPLHCAANSGSNEIAKLLTSKGADVNVIAQLGTPLGFAARYGHPDVLKYLLEMKANPNPDLSSVMTPLACSINGMPKPNIECMELLLKAGADPNHQCMGRTSLCLAAGLPDEDTVRCLLKSGGDPNIPDCVGFTPLDYAALLGRCNTVKILFPVTSRIACYPDWSIKGVIRHAKSEEAKALFMSKQKELAVFAKSKGDEAFKRKKYLDAGNWYSQAFLADPYDIKVLSNRSLCSAKTKSGMKALHDALACVSLEPGWVKGHYREGAAWTVLKDFKKAAKAFSRALDLDPGNKEIEKAYRAVQAELN